MYPEPDVTLEKFAIQIEVYEMDFIVGVHYAARDSEGWHDLHYAILQENEDGNLFQVPDMEQDSLVEEAILDEIHNMERKASKDESGRTSFYPDFSQQDYQRIYKKED